MTNEDYSQLAMRTAPQVDTQRDRLILCALGIGGESGEIVDTIKKIIFHGHPFDAEIREKLIKEMGDVEWYLNFLRVILGVTLEDVHEQNIAKLAARYPEGFFSTDRSLHRAEGDV